MTPDTLAIRAAIEQLLDELELRAYIFTHEAKAHGLQLHIECATDDAWQTVSLPANPSELLASLHDVAVREQLREAWRERLRDCAKRGESSPPT
ncbi:MAG TPA: hypothetical protein VFR86_15670 [Burkholderiaceae bacterium]|nr:hypothetical protein [Burkholderiaceae bacterium]